MSSRKQRRRRAKERRHEYEIVYVDQEGHEVEPPPEEIEKQAVSKNGKPTEKPKTKAKTPAKKGGASTGAVRKVPAPSWQRVAKRGAVFAPFMFITLYLLGGTKHGLAPVVIQTVWLLLLFIPFSYLIDRMMYRRYLRNTGQLKEEPRKAKPKKS
jgi:hypothetical protein